MRSVAGSPEICWVESRRPRFGSLTVVERLLELGRSNIRARLEQAMTIEPVNTVEGREFKGIHSTAWRPPSNHLGLEQVVDRLGERVVVAVADAADRGLHTGSAGRSV